MSQLPTESWSDASYQAVRALSADDRATLRERVSSLIQAREQGIRYAESRLNSLAFLSGGLIAAGLAFLSLSQSVTPDPARWGLGTVGVALFALALALLVVYARSTNPTYPFIDADADVKRGRWKWFYWDALPDASKFADVGLWGRHRGGARNAEINETNRQFPIFVQRTTEGLTDEGADVADDLRQLFTLHINERYKNHYLTSVRKILQRGLLVVLFVGGSAAVIAALLDTDDGRRSSVSRDNGVEVEFDWSTTRSASGSTSVDLTVRVENLSDSDFSATQLRAMDESGFNLPIAVASFSEPVSPGAVAEFKLEVEAPSSYVREIDSWLLE